jgi:hypothetical protein
MVSALLICLSYITSRIGFFQVFFFIIRGFFNFSWSLLIFLFESQDCLILNSKVFLWTTRHICCEGKQVFRTWSQAVMCFLLFSTFSLQDYLMYLLLCYLCIISFNSYPEKQRQPAYEACLIEETMAYWGLSQSKSCTRISQEFTGKVI